MKLLNEADVAYLLIGDYAVGYHGYPRATEDMDIFVAISPDNAGKLVDVFSRFGMADPIDKQRVNLISSNHLRKNKKASARHKDLDDLENLPEEDSENTTNESTHTNQIARDLI